MTETTGGIERVEELIGEIERVAPPDVCELARQLVQEVMTMHARGLARACALAGPEVLERMAGDEVAAALLLLYELHPHSPERRITAALERERAFLVRIGATVESVAIEGAVARVQVIGELRPDARAEVARLALASAPEIEKVTVERTGVALVPLSRLSRSAAEPGS